VSSRPLDGEDSLPAGRIEPPRNLLPELTGGVEAMTICLPDVDLPGTPTFVAQIHTPIESLWKIRCSDL
jgi:hypothetical protein